MSVPQVEGHSNDNGSQRRRPHAAQRIDARCYLEAAASDVGCGRDYVLILVEHPDMIAKSMGYNGPILIDYEATLAVLHRETGIKMLINLESTDSTRCFCAFTMDGEHENYGGATDMTTEAFTERALEMFRKRFDFSGMITKL
jgi:hypothetical protein